MSNTAHDLLRRAREKIESYGKHCPQCGHEKPDHWGSCSRAQVITEIDAELGEQPCKTCGEPTTKEECLECAVPDLVAWAKEEPNPCIDAELEGK